MNLDLQQTLPERLPTSDELSCSDDTPVDNEDQNFLPNFLLFLLSSIWAQRMDWYFGVDMGVYHTTGPSPKMPQSAKQESLRLAEKLRQLGIDPDMP